MSWLGYNKKSLRGSKKPKLGQETGGQELKVVPSPKPAAPKPTAPPRDEAREVRLY